MAARSKSTNVAGKRSGSSGAARPERQLKAFIEKFDAPDDRRIRAERAALRKRLPTAHELVWDNYNFFVIGYSPTERPTDSPSGLISVLPVSRRWSPTRPTW